MPKIIAITFGKFNPPHIGHHALAQGLVSYANNLSVPHMIYSSRRHMKATKTPKPHKDTPLDPEKKLVHLRRAFQTDNVQLATSPHEVIQKLIDDGHEVHLMLGSDRIEDTAPGLYEKFGTEKLKIIPFGETRSKEATGVAGASSTKMRQHAIEKNYNAFKEQLPPHMTNDHAEELYTDVRSGLKAAGEKLNEEVSAQTRLKLSRIAKRTAKIRAVKRKARQRRRRNLPQLKKRAKQSVKSNLRHRYFKGSWQKLGYGTRVSIDRNVNKRKKIADSMIKRILPNVIRGESERLNNLSTRRESLENIILPLLLEARTGQRKSGSTKTGANSAKERAQARGRKRKQRTKEDASKKAGNVQGKFAVVRGKTGKFRGKLMVIDSGSVDPSKHSIITKPQDFDLGDGQKILTDKKFVNTDSSIELYGMQRGEMTAPRKTKEKPKQEAKKPKATKATKAAKAPRTQKEELPPIDFKIDQNWQMPKDMKSRGFKAADHEWAFVALAEMLVNNQDPKKLIKEGSLTEEQYMQLADNRNLTQAALRVLENSGFMGSKKGKYRFMHSGTAGGMKNSDLYRDIGAVNNTSKADVIVEDLEAKDNDPMKVMGISFKSGAAQLGSSKEKETKAMATYAYEKTKKNMDKRCRGLIENLIDKGFEQMSESLKLPGGIDVFKKDVGGVASANPKVAKAVNDSIKINKGLEKDIADIFDNCKPFKKALLHEAATGEGKFANQYNEEIFKKTGKKLNTGIATHVLAISDDAKNASLVPIDEDFIDKIEPEVKMYVAAKTTDAGTSADIKEYKDTKEQLIAASKEGKFSAFKNIVEKRVYEGYKRKGIKPPSFNDKELKSMMDKISKTDSLPNAFKFKLLQAKAALRFGVAGQKGEIEESIVYKFMKKFISEEATVAIDADFEDNNGQNSIYDQLYDLQDSGDLESVDPDQWLEMSKEFVGDDLMKFLEFMGVELNGFDTNSINFADMFAQQYSPRMNTVYINGRPKYIPVMEEILNERNYRKEYDNYHSKPEQRKNRSKRVQARRLMQKLGKVRKGDGKDVDHKDGNPKNNGKHNLRVRSKSANRADND
jgi:hypothetical protein